MTDSPDESRAILAAIVATSDDAIVSKNLRGIVQSWNRGAEQMFGFTADEMIGQPITKIIPPDRLHEEPAILEKLKRGEKVDHFETIRQRKDGKLIHISVTISPLRDASGRVIGASKIARDISQQVKLAKEQKRLYELGKKIASEPSIGNIVQFITDAATELSGAQFGAFFYNVVNQSGQSYMLYTLSGVSKEHFDKFPMPRNTAVFGPTFAGEGIVRSDDITKDPRYGKNTPHHGMPKGHLPVRSYLAAPVLNGARDVLGGLFFGHAEAGVFNQQSEEVVAAIAGHAGIALDNARLQRERDQILGAERAARSEAERVSRMKDEFLATLSHELRTPLNAILGWSQLIQKSKDDKETLQEGLEVIERNARAQSQLIGDLLDISRIVSGKVRLDVQRFDLSAAIAAAIESVQPSADAKGIQLKKVLDPAAIVSGDPNRIQQVVWNVLTNAIKFTPKGGKVEVLLERVNSHIEITVSDTGAGISPEFLPYVFDRFRQEDSSITRKHGGLGLGLSIVKNLVELHGGQVNVKSRGEGQGSTFTITLPSLITKHSGEERHHPGSLSRVGETGTDQVSLQGLTILVVDDERDGRELVRRVLAERGANVWVADSVERSLEIFNTTTPDILVSDLGMSPLDGYELIKRVRRMPAEKGGKIPAIALTAFARSEDRTRAMVAGFQMHMAKPVESQELVAAISTLTGRFG